MKTNGFTINCHCEECESTTKQSTGIFKNGLPRSRWSLAMTLGFTLVEVLITLTIIGVIAAITIPNLMKSYRKHEVEVKLKEAYSILNNALKMAQADGKADSMSDMLDTMNKSASGNARYTFFSENYLVPYLKVSKTCVPDTNYITCGIFSDVRPKDMLGQNTSNASFYHSDQKYNILLSNGMIFGIGSKTNDVPLAILVDINGKKGPNKLAHDIFYFSLEVPNNHSSAYYRTQENVLIGGAYGTSPYNISSAKTECIQKINTGHSCAILIQMNNWKIPDNYPVKKF